MTLDHDKCTMLYELPKLPEPWEWRVRVGGFWAACLFTQDTDCIVEVDGSSVRISTGVAPMEVVESVLNFKKDQDERASNCSPQA